MNNKKQNSLKLNINNSQASFQLSNISNVEAFIYKSDKESKNQIGTINRVIERANSKKEIFPNNNDDIFTTGK